MDRQIEDVIYQLEHHPLYECLSDPEKLRIFMSYHVFAVWDFMGLIKRLQNEVTCTKLPWRPSQYPAWMVRLTNAIVKDEESDLDLNQEPLSHFEMYLDAMDEVGADSTAIRNFIKEMDISLVPEVARPFVDFSLDTTLLGKPLEVAGAFFWGREKIVPLMFKQITPVLSKEKYPKLYYYLDRHIELDSGEHSETADEFITQMSLHLASNKDEAYRKALEAIKQRVAFWDRIHELIICSQE